MPFLRRLTGVLTACCLCGNLLLARPDYFTPQHRISGIGVDRSTMSPAVLDERTSRMIQAQTFAIMRDPRAVAGAARVTSPALSALFREAAARSHWPASLIAAIAYLETFGDANAQSPAGPKGIMQFSEATARAAGLRIVRATRFKTTTERKLVRSGKKSKPAYRMVTRRVPYTVTVRDDRLVPSRAIPAAASYLARLEAKFGGRDWAIFAFHCGEGCVSEMQPLTEAALGSHHQKLTVAAMFFAAHPALHRDLYAAIQRHLDRDYSPTYWFRVTRAEQLLNLYQTDPSAFRELAEQYRNPVDPDRRASDRLVVWLKSEDVFYKTAQDLKLASGKSLERVLDDPKSFGFTPPLAPGTQDLYLQGSPSAIGTLLYIAFETRRLFEALKPRGERFVPLQVVELVSTTDRPAEGGSLLVDPEFPEHATGHVFDIDRSNLPRGERECLDFILDDLGWNGYLGFIQVTGDTLHIGCAPSAREFFETVFAEATLERN